MDDKGRPAPFQPGDRVYVIPSKTEATVKYQYLVHDGDVFWSNVLLQYDDGTTGTSNNWQLKHLDK